MNETKTNDLIFAFVKAGLLVVLGGIITFLVQPGVQKRAEQGKICDNVIKNEGKLIGLSANSRASYEPKPYIDEIRGSTVYGAGPGVDAVKAFIAANENPADGG